MTEDTKERCQKVRARETEREREKDELICQAIRAIAGSTKLHLVPFLLLPNTFSSAA